MSIARKFVSSKCINTRNSKSSSLFRTNTNNKKQKYIKKKISAKIQNILIKRQLRRFAIQ